VRLLEAAAAQGAAIAGLGELFPAPYFALHEEPMWTGLAEDVEHGETVSTLRAAARRLGLHLVAPIYELDGRSGRRFNTAVVIGAGGELLGTYRKAHIPFGANEQGGFCETLSTTQRHTVARAGERVANRSSGVRGPLTRRRAIWKPGTSEGSAIPRRGELIFTPMTFGEKTAWRLERGRRPRHVFIAASNLGRGRRGTRVLRRQPLRRPAGRRTSRRGRHQQIGLTTLGSPIRRVGPPRDVRHEIYSRRP
jgi:hypothetical protein